jgi:hypothetical protein
MMVHASTLHPFSDSAAQDRKERRRSCHNDTGAAIVMGFVDRPYRIAIVGAATERPPIAK